MSIIISHIVVCDSGRSRLCEKRTAGERTISESREEAARNGWRARRDPIDRRRRRDLCPACLAVEDGQ